MSLLDLAAVVYSAVSRDLNDHIVTCNLGCRGGSGWDMCPVGDRLLDRMLSAYLAGEDDQ